MHQNSVLEEKFSSTVVALLTHQGAPEPIEAILKFTMRSKILTTLALLGAAFAADVPRKAPEYAIKLADGKQALVSSYRGKVLCLAFILTT